MRPGERVDQFIGAVLRYGLKEGAARIFAIDALIDYAAERVREALAERDAGWRSAVRGSVREYHCEPDETPCGDCAPLRALMVGPS